MAADYAVQCWAACVEVPVLGSESVACCDLTGVALETSDAVAVRRGRSTWESGIFSHTPFRHGTK